MPTPAPFRASSSLHGLSAVVTGGSRGLGLLIADELLHRGCGVTLVARDSAELERADELLRRRHPESSVRTAVTDVRDKEAVADLFRRTAAACGSIDVVVANAGIIQVAPAETVGEAYFLRCDEQHLPRRAQHQPRSTPHLRASRAGGRLALIGSVGGLLAVPHLLPYSCAKAAVGALAEGLYAEAARDGVSVTAVHPGLMRTGSHLHALFAGDRRREFAWFSALAGTPLISMDARRAANRIVTAVQRRRVRLVLTPPRAPPTRPTGSPPRSSPGSARWRPRSARPPRTSPLHAPVSTWSRLPAHVRRAPAFRGQRAERPGGTRLQRTSPRRSRTRPALTPDHGPPVRPEERS